MHKNISTTGLWIHKLLHKKLVRLLTFVLLWTWALLDRRAKVSNLNICTIISLCRCYLSYANYSRVLLKSILLLFDQNFIIIINFNLDMFSILFWVFPVEQEKLIKHFVLKIIYFVTLLYTPRGWSSMHWLWEILQNIILVKTPICCILS